MGCELVTGVAGHPHIDGDDIASLMTGLIGPDDCVLATGEGLPARMETSNTLSLGTGDLLMQGRHVRFASSSTVTVESGTPGMKRNDLLVCRYMKASDGMETASLVILKGAPTSGTPQDPAWEHGRIIEGATTADMPLYRIPLDGITVQALKPMFTTMKPVNKADDGSTPRLIPFNDWCEPLNKNKGEVFIKQDESWLMVCGPIAFLSLSVTFASSENNNRSLVHLKPPYQAARQVWAMGNGSAYRSGSFMLPASGRISQPGTLENGDYGCVIKDWSDPSAPISNYRISICYPLDTAAQTAS